MTYSTTFLSATSLKAFLYEYTAEEILQRRQEGSAATSQAASLGKDIAGADGETMIGEACADSAQLCSHRLKLEYMLQQISLYLLESMADVGKCSTGHRNEQGSYPGWTSGCVI